jgi:hypothetical protein
MPLVEVQVTPRDEPLATREIALGEARLVATVGPLRVRETVAGYRETRRGQAFTFSLDEPLDTVLDTVGLWIDMPAELEPDDASMHAVEHALVNALPLALLCDRRDIGSSSDEQRLYVYDFAEGGIGLSEKAFHVLETLVERAVSLVRECPCTGGCPSCMHLPGCPRANSSLDKAAGLALLEGRGVGGARAVERMLRGAAPDGSDERTREPAGRRRRFRAIADADLRDRYGGHPNWLQERGLADLEGAGLVVVWAIGRGTAEVQPLSGGEARWVPIKQLSPPQAR